MNKLFSSLRRSRKTESRKASRRKRLRMEPLEDRRLLATLNLVTAGSSDGLLVFTGGAVDNDLDVSYDEVAGEYTFSDPNDPISTLGGLSGLDTNPDPNIVTFNAALADAATTGGSILSVVINPALGNDTTTISSFRAGGEGLDIRNTPGQGTDTVNVVGNVGTAAMPTENEVQLRAEVINFDSNIWTNGHGVRFQGPVNVGPGLHVVETGAGVGSGLTFTDTVDGPGGLDVASEDVRFIGPVGSVTPLGQLTASGDVVEIADVTTNMGDQLYEADTFIPSGNISGTAFLVIRQFTPGGDITLFTDELGFIQPGFLQVTLGAFNTGTLTLGADADNTLATGSLSVSAPLAMIADRLIILDSIDTGAVFLSLITNDLLMTGRGTVVGGGDLFISKRNVGGTLVINAPIGRHYDWGQSNLQIFADPTATVVTTRALGSEIDDLIVNAGAFNHFVFRTAINVHGTVAINTDTLNLSGGIFSSGGNISVNSPAINLFSNTLFIVPGGGSLSVDGDVNANGGNVTVRPVGGPIASVDFNGDVADAGRFAIDTGGANTAVSVSVDNVLAESVSIRSLAINTDGIIAATAGSVHLFGNVNLQGNTSLLGTSGIASNFVRVDGTIDGGFDLTINSGNGATVLTGIVGGSTALVNMNVMAGGTSFITRAITVDNDFSWATCGGGANRLLVLAQITAGNDVTLQAAILDVRVTPIHGGVLTELFFC